MRRGGFYDRFIGRLWRRRVPVLLQLNAVECGAACLAMILTYYGRKTGVTECRDICGVGRDGISAQTIARAARAYGLRACAFSLEPGEFRQARLPAIAHWEFNHFVVVERWTPHRIDIVDPAAGRRRLTAAEFDAGLTGVVLTLEPGIHFEQRRSTTRPIWRSYLLAMLRAPGTPALLVQVMAASSCLLLLGLTLPLFTKLIVDRLLPLHVVGPMSILAAALALIVAAQAVAAYLRSVLLLYLRGRLDMQMMLGFFEHLLSLPFCFFHKRNSGDLLMRLSSNAIIREALTSQTLSATLDGALVVGYLAILLIRTPLFGALIFGAGVVQIAVLLITSGYRRELTQRDLAAQSASQSYLVEAMSGLSALKAAGTEDHAIEYWSSLFAGELNASLRRGHLSAVVDTVIFLLRTLAPLLLLWVGTFQVVHGTMSLGTMLALVALATGFLEPLASLVSHGQRLQLVAAHLDRIVDVMHAEPEQDSRLAHATPRLTGRIELRHVSFRYDPNGPFILNDISLAIQPGQKVALVGRTGSGKSTLLMLLLGLYRPTHGEILLDGMPLHSLNYRDVRSQFGVVLQDPFLFSGSIRQNITFGSPGLTVDQLIHAARLAAIHDEIVKMPMGYETRLAESGVGLSGGQRQRLSLARALARQPAILLLDEATSHLDVLTEQLVLHNLCAVANTNLVIAHRLSTIRHVDRILVLEGGRIVEQGTHEDLAARRGHYAELVSSQMGGCLGRCSRGMTCRRNE